VRSFDPGFTPNMTDFQGRRYCYSNLRFSNNILISNPIVYCSFTVCSFDPRLNPNMTDFQGRRCCYSNPRFSDNIVIFNPVVYCCSTVCSFDPGFTPNMTDFQGRRYCYSNQPQAVQWNCIQLANALFSADLVEKEAAEEALSRYAEVSRVVYCARFYGFWLLA
jgi:hypothetical protein